MGRHALKARMPRVLPDHRSAEARRIREVYLESLKKHPDANGEARRLAVMTAQAWVDYEDLGVQITRAKKNKRSALVIRRLKKERRLAAGHYLGGIRELDALFKSNGHQEPRVEDLMALPNLGGSA